MREAELGQKPALIVQHKNPLLLLPSLHPASCEMKPKWVQNTPMFSGAPLAKHKDFRIMITGDIYAVR